MCARLQEPLGDLRSSVACVGVSVSGDVDTATGVVRDSAIMGWHGVELAAALREHLDAEIVVDNDVRALTIGEHWFGVGLGTRSFAIVTIGRGIGEAVISMRLMIERSGAPPIRPDPQQGAARIRPDPGRALQGAEPARGR